MKINTINGNDASETLIHKNTSRQAQKAQKHMGEKHHIHTEENAVSSLITNRWKIPVLVTKKLLKCRRQKEGAERMNSSLKLQGTMPADCKGFLFIGDVPKQFPPFLTPF